MNLFYFRFIVITPIPLITNTVLSGLKKTHCNFILKKIEEIAIFGEIQENLFLAQRHTL